MKLMAGMVAGLIVLGAAGCSSEPSAAAVMPAVVGVRLDSALGAIQAAGFDDDVEIDGGGTFGVVDESNWIVCAQDPAAGAVVSKPRLTVDRSCEMTGATEAATSATSLAGAPAGTDSAVPTVLTVETSPELGALLVVPDPCDATVGQFAAGHNGATLAFNGNIGALSNHGDANTRFDILIQPGDYSETSAVGPTFQFQDVGITDLGLTGPNIPDQLRSGDNIKVVATVGGYDPGSCLFQLDPVSTEYR